MSKIAYEHATFTAEAREVVRQAEAICQEYADAGYGLTLRQLYYRFIARNLFPDSRYFYKVEGSDREIHDPLHENPRSTKNVQRNYKWLGDLCGKARMSGLIDWNHLEDRTRSSTGGDGGWDSPADAVRSMDSWYSISHWVGQPEYLEAWVEKEALDEIVGRAASRWNVAHMACKGYVSLSEMHVAARRLRAREREGKKTTILYLGDHDPSGLDMSRNVQDQLSIFGSGVTVERIALNMDQIQELDPPPSPAKAGDSRSEGYVAQYGVDTWELDAIEPAQLETIVTDAIMPHLVLDLYNARLRQEERERATLTALADNWPDVNQYLIDQDMIDEPEQEDDTE